MISLSCFACTKGLHHVVESAINSDSGDFQSVYQTHLSQELSARVVVHRVA